MQKLKVYLNKQNKNTNDKIRLNLIKTKHMLETQFDYSTNSNGNTNTNAHHISHTNPNHYTNVGHLVKSNMTKNYHNQNHSHSNQPTHNNAKKRTHSNMHSRSLQQINDFRMDIHDIIKKPGRYQNYLEVCRKDKDKEKELSLSKDKDENSSKDKDANIKKNSKQIASDSRLNYRPGQINSETQKIEKQKIKKINKSERNLDILSFKNTHHTNQGVNTNNFNTKNLSDLNIDIKAGVNLRAGKQQNNNKLANKNISVYVNNSNQSYQQIYNNHNSNKIPNKKRSKSAHPNASNLSNKRLQQEQPKRKRSNSTKKVAKTKQKQKNGKIKKQELKLSYVINKINFPRQIQMKSMFRTRKGVQIMNPNKVNQDRFYIKENLQLPNHSNTGNSKSMTNSMGNSMSNSINIMNRFINIYAVADGHGPLGHCVSHLIVQNLQKKLQGYLRQNKTIQYSLDRSFHDIQSILFKNIEFTAEFSGSTLVTLVIENNKRVVCANVGDSRAIVARQLNKSNWEIIRLSNDHKPNLQEQKARILAHGGRIQTVYDQMGKSVGPLRVWLPKKQLQGLAMSRSLGDNVSKPIGVTHQPQILIHQLSKQDKFILLASDGVWQFLTNYQILSLIIPYYRQNRLEDACQALMKQAYKSWTVQDNSVVDDITFILIFIYPNPNSNGNNNIEGKGKQKQKQEKQDKSNAQIQQLNQDENEASKYSQENESKLIIGRLSKLTKQKQTQDKLDRGKIQIRQEAGETQQKQLRRQKQIKQRQNESVSIDIGKGIDVVKKGQVLSQDAQQFLPSLGRIKKYNDKNSLFAQSEMKNKDKLRQKQVLTKFKPNQKQQKSKQIHQNRQQKQQDQQNLQQVKL